MKCPSCRTENRDEAKFCKRCGQALDATQRISPMSSDLPGSSDTSKTVIADGGQPAQGPQPSSRPSPPAVEQNTVAADHHQESGTDPIGTGSPPDSPGQTPPGSGHLEGTVIIDSASPKQHSLPRRALVGWLVTFSSNPNGQDYRLFEGRNIVGKDPSEGCDIVLADQAVSSKHALLLFRSGQSAIIDQDSTNGTWVNGGDIGMGGRKDLTDNDIIKLGTTVFVFKCFEKPEE